MQLFFQILSHIADIEEQALCCRQSAILMCCVNQIRASVIKDKQRKTKQKLAVCSLLFDSLCLSHCGEVKA